MNSCRRGKVLATQTNWRIINLGVRDGSGDLEGSRTPVTFQTSSPPMNGSPIETQCRNNDHSGFGVSMGLKWKVATVFWGPSYFLGLEGKNRRKREKRIERERKRDFFGFSTVNHRCDFDKEADFFLWRCFWSCKGAFNIMNCVCSFNPFILLPFFLRLLLFHFHSHIIRFEALGPSPSLLSQSSHQDQNQNQNHIFRFYFISLFLFHKSSIQYKIK